jgi:hypothetical protein
MTIPGVGPVTASAITATVQDPGAFASGREFAAFLGLTPRQNSSGGKQRLGRITKMGDRYLRKLLVIGACATLRHRKGHTDALRLWANGMLERKTVNALRPPVPLAPSAWAKANLIVPDGPGAGQVFDLSLTPYLAEPLDMLGPDSPVNEIAAMKSAQTGFTLLLIALIGYLVDRRREPQSPRAGWSDSGSRRRDPGRIGADHAVAACPAARVVSRQAPLRGARGALAW